MKYDDQIAMKIFYRVFVEGRTNRAVANDKDIHLTEDTVGKYVKHIRDNHVMFIPKFPPIAVTTHNLSERFKLKTSVALSGDEPKNIGPVAHEAVNIFLKVIEELHADTPLRIAVGCGETIRFFSDALMMRLHSDPDARSLLLNMRTIEIMPTAIIPGRRYDTTFPSFLVAQFFSRLAQVLPKNYIDRYIHAYVPTLADSFSKLSAREQITYYNSTLKEDLDLMRTCQIILLGIGGMEDEHFKKVAPNIGLPANPDYAHINYQPIDNRGWPVHTEYKICGLSLKELAQFAKDENRAIIAMAGGEKHRYVESVFRNAHNLPFNYFVTDIHIANHLLTTFSHLRGAVSSA